MAEHPFDTAAGEYDRLFTDPVPGRWFRDAVWKQVLTWFDPGRHLLDLGCGTGEDAVWMAGQGMRITALDASLEMLKIAERKARECNVSDRIVFQQGDLSALEVEGLHDGALSDFGAVNCVFDLKILAERLAPAIKKDGHVIFVVMGPCCPWEIMWYLLHGNIGQAFRRFRSFTDAPVSEGKTIRIWYPSPRRFQKDFSPQFERVRTMAIGALVPPPYLDGLVRRATSFFHLLWKIEQRMGSLFPLSWMNDHYLMVLKRM